MNNTQNLQVVVDSYQNTSFALSMTNSNDSPVAAYLAIGMNRDSKQPSIIVVRA